MAQNHGDAVAKDEPLFEISTDKVDAEIPSPAAGVLTEIRFPEGATVEVNTVVAVIGEAGAKADAPADNVNMHNRQSKRLPPPQVASPATAAPKSSPSAVQSPVQKAAPPQVGRIRSSPLARRIAKDHGLDLARVAGSGSEGRVTKEDVLRAAKQLASAAKPLGHIG